MARLRASGRAIANVTVRDGNGALVNGATVNGTWSGLVSGSGNTLTSSTGVATLNPPNTKARGTFIFTVTGVTLPGYGYNPALNSETTDSITR